MVVLAIFVVSLILNAVIGRNCDICLIHMYPCIDESSDCYLASQLAFELALDIASTQSDMLIGCNIRPSHSKQQTNSQYQSQGNINVLIAEQLFQFLQESVNLPGNCFIPLIIGPPHSHLNEILAYSTDPPENIVQVTYDSTSISLNNKKRYPYLHRVDPTQAFLNIARCETLKKHGWKRVGVISSLERTVHATTMQNLVNLLNKDNYFKTVVEVSYTGGDNLGVLLQTFKSNDIRIIVGLFDSIDNERVLCQASEIGLTDQFHVWILEKSNWNTSRNFSCDLNSSQILLLDFLLAQSDNVQLTTSPPLPNNAQFDQLLIQKAASLGVLASQKQDILGYRYAEVAFDATWAALLAINHSLAAFVQQNITAENKSAIRAIMNESLSNVNFNGTSGKQCFNMSRDKFGTAIISQVIGKAINQIEIFHVPSETSDGKFLPYTRDDGNISDYSWGNTPPLSEGLVLIKVINRLWLYAIIFLTGVFWFVCLTFAIATVALRNHKSIKSSSPKINLVLLLGAVLTFSTVVADVITASAVDYDLTELQFSTLCQIQRSVRYNGMVMIYSPLFVKIWRLYRLFYNKQLKILIRFISDRSLLLIIVLMQLPQIVITITQLAIDRPTEGAMRSTFPDPLDNYPYTSTEFSYCHFQHNNLWSCLLFFYAYSIIFMTFFLAIRVSNVKRQAFADEGLATVRVFFIITIVITLGTIGWFPSLEQENLIGLFITEVLIYFVHPCVAVCLIFLPNLWRAYKTAA